MTPAEVRRRVQMIKEIASDDEAAHSMEDALRHDVLSAIAAGAENAGTLARSVLRTSEIAFERWCA